MDLSTSSNCAQFPGKNHPDVTIKFTVVNVRRQISPLVREIFIEVDHAENDIDQLSETYEDIRANVLEGKKSYTLQDVPISNILVLNDRFFDLYINFFSTMVVKMSKLL